MNTLYLYSHVINKLYSVRTMHRSDPEPQPQSEVDSKSAYTRSSSKQCYDINRYMYKIVLTGDRTFSKYRRKIGDSGRNRRFFGDWVGCNAILRL